MGHPAAGQTSKRHTELSSPPYTSLCLLQQRLEKEKKSGMALACFLHRRIEWPGLKRTTMLTQFQPPAVCRVTNHQPRLPRATSSLAVVSAVCFCLSCPLFSFSLQSQTSPDKTELLWKLRAVSRVSLRYPLLKTQSRPDGTAARLSACTTCRGPARAVVRWGSSKQRTKRKTHTYTKTQEFSPQSRILYAA